MKGIRLAAAVFAVAALTTGMPAWAADCGKAGAISISEMTWPSSGMLAHLTAKILQKGYGCEVQVTPGDTVPTASTMLTRGTPDIVPELWISLVPDVWKQIEEKGSYFAVADTYKDGVAEGLWIPRYLAEKHPEIKSITDLGKGDNWKLFTEPSSPDKGVLYACPPGWGCEVTIPQYYKALGLQEKFKLFSPGSGGAMKANIVRRLEQKEPIVTYYWSPTDLVGKYDMVMLESPAHDEQQWLCITDPNCPDPKPTGYKPGITKLVAASRLKEDAPDVVAYLEKQTIPNEVVNKLLAWADENKASTEDMANRFLQEHGDVWQSWLPDDVAAKLK